VPLGELDALQPVGGFVDDVEIRLPLQQQPDAGAEQGVVVDEQDADGH